MNRHPKDDQRTDVRTELVGSILVALAETPSGGEALAAKLARQSCRRIRVVRFSTRDVVETFEP